MRQTKLEHGISHEAVVGSNVSVDVVCTNFRIGGLTARCKLNSNSRISVITQSPAQGKICIDGGQWSGGLNTVVGFKIVLFSWDSA